MTEETRLELARRQVRQLVLALTALILLGAVGTVASVYTARSTAAARRADVAAVQQQSEQNARLIGQVCRIVFDVAKAAEIVVEPCAIPTPVASPLVGR